MMRPIMLIVTMMVETVVDPASIQSIAVIVNVLWSRSERWLTTMLFLQMAIVRMNLIMHNAIMMALIVVHLLEIINIALNVIAKVLERI